MSDEKSDEKAEQDFSYREDLKRAGGLDIRLDQNDVGPHVREKLMLRDMPFWRGGVPALMVRCYEDGTVTMAEDVWMEEKK